MKYFIVVMLFFITLRSNAKLLPFDITYATDFVSILDSGAEKTSYLLGWLEISKQWQISKRVSLYVSAQGTHGDNPSSGVGDLAGVSDEGGVSNIATDSNTFKLYQVYLQFQAGQLSGLIGFYDINSEFYVTESSLLFLHSSFGIGSELGQTGVMGPSIFPNLSYGVKGEFTGQKFYLRSALVNAVGSNVENPYGTHPHWSLDQGILVITEIGQEDQGSKVALGGWFYSQQEAVMTDDNLAHNWGVYLLYDQPFSLGSYFLRFGWANADINELEWNGAIGVVFNTNWWREDQLGIGWNTIYASKGSSFNEHHESVVEMTYHLQWNNWLEIQPDLQYVLNPGLDSGNQNALIFIQRLIVSF